MAEAEQASSRKGARHRKLQQGFPLNPRRSKGSKKQPCNASLGHLERPLISAIVQTFGDGDNSQQLAGRAHSLPGVELLVNADSRVDSGKWMRALRGANDYLLMSPNIHEIRAYNRLARMARGDYLLLLQGDHCLPRDPAWLRDGLALFERFPRLGMIGGQMGFDEVPYKKVAENVSWGIAPCRPIPMATQLSLSAGAVAVGTEQVRGRALAEQGRGRAHARKRRTHKTKAGSQATVRSIPFMFVAGVNIGPLLIRREAFLHVGGFDEAFSCVGQPGIQLDTDLSLQLWQEGFQVGLWYSAVSNGVGGRKTRTNPAQKRARNQNDVRNGKRCERTFKRHDAAAVAKANAELQRLDDPAASREAHLSTRGALTPKHCSD